MRGLYGIKDGDCVVHDTAKKQNIGRYRSLPALFFRDPRMVAVEEFENFELPPHVAWEVELSRGSREALMPLRRKLMQYLVDTWQEDDNSPVDPLREEAVAAIVSMDSKILYYNHVLMDQIRAQEAQPKLRYNAAELSEVIQHSLNVLEKVHGVNTPLQ